MNPAWLLALAGLIAPDATAADIAPAATSECVWDSSFVDADRPALDAERVAALPWEQRPRLLSLRDLVERLGPAPRHESTKTGWHALIWPVSDGTQLTAAGDGCSPAPILFLRGVADGSEQPDSPEAVARALYRWIIESPHQAEEPHWSSTIGGLVGKPLFRALELERAAYLACDAWQRSQLPLKWKWEAFVDSFSRDGSQPTYNDMALEPRARFIAHLYPIGAIDITREGSGLESDTATVRVRVNDGRISWTERVLLAREEDRWVIVNVWHGDPSSDLISTTQELVENARYTTATCLCAQLSNCPMAELRP